MQLGHEHASTTSIYTLTSPDYQSRALEAAQMNGATNVDADLLPLWRERVGLMDALVDVHLTRAQNVGL